MAWTQNELRQQIKEQLRNARETVAVCEFVLAVLPSLMKLPEVNWSVAYELVEAMRADTLKGAKDRLRVFARSWSDTTEGSDLLSLVHYS